MFFVLVEINVGVRMVSAPSDFAFFHGFLNGTTRFVGVGAVVEATFFGSLENFGEIVRNAVAFEFYKSEGTNTRSINNIPTKVEF